MAVSLEVDRLDQLGDRIVTAAADYLLINNNNLSWVIFGFLGSRGLGVAQFI